MRRSGLRSEDAWENVPSAATSYWPSDPLIVKPRVLSVPAGGRRSRIATSALAYWPKYTSRYDTEKVMLAVPA